MFLLIKLGNTYIKFALSNNNQIENLAKLSHTYDLENFIIEQFLQTPSLDFVMQEFNSQRYLFN